MRLPRVRFTVGGMIVGAAVLGFALAAFLSHPVLGLVTACVACLTIVRTTGAIHRLRGEGVVLTLGQRIHLFASSWVVASLLIVIPDVTFLVTHEGYAQGWNRPTHYRYDVDPDGVVLGVFLGTLVASLLRLLLWPSKRWGIRPLRPFFFEPPEASREKQRP